MEIYALIGKSGTGKSYNAQNIMGQYGIDYVIDDGLFINGNKILAGSSAKREKTKFAAVRRAIFTDINHKKDIISALEKNVPNKLLILGTSEHMIQKIIKVLNINKTYTSIKIEDIVSKEELNTAIRARNVFGMHVIPVPTFEIKKAFSGYFISSIKQLSRKNEKNALLTENTVVRPTFSYLGSFEIKDSVLKEIIIKTSVETININKVTTIDIKKGMDGVKITIAVVVNLNEPIPKIVNCMVERVKNNVEFMTGIYVIETNVVVKGAIL